VSINCCLAFPILNSFGIFLYSISSGYFYIASLLLLGGAPDYSIDTVSELICRNVTGNYKWRTCPRSLRGGKSGIRKWDLYLPL